MTLTQSSGLAGTLNIGSTLSSGTVIGIQGQVASNGALANIRIGVDGTGEINQTCIKLNTTNYGASSSNNAAALSVTKTAVYDVGSIKQAGVFITSEDIKLMGNTMQGTGAGSYGTRISLTASSGAIECIKLTQSSDARLKENLQRFFEPKKSILDLPVYTYNFIGRDEKMLGCLAQDLQEICPEIVNEDTNGYLSIQESKIVYLLLEEVKKLRAELDRLNTKQEIK